MVCKQSGHHQTRFIRERVAKMHSVLTRQSRAFCVLCVIRCVPCLFPPPPPPAHIYELARIAQRSLHSLRGPQVNRFRSYKGREVQRKLLHGHSHRYGEHHRGPHPYKWLTCDQSNILAPTSLYHQTAFIRDIELDLNSGTSQRWH